MNAPLVLNTRPREHAAELSRLLLEAGFRPLEAPTVEVVPAWSAEQIEPVLAKLRAGRYAWIVFPSKNAVVYLIRALVSVGGRPRDLARARIVSGPGTAQVLVERGLAADRVLHRFSAIGAVEALEDERLYGRSILVPRATEGRDELIEGFRERNIPVDELVLYRTRSVAPAALVEAAGRLRRREVAAVTFTSPSTARGLVDGLAGLGLDPRGCLDAARVVCLGGTTEAEVRALGLRTDRVAEQTTLPSLVRAVADAVGIALAAAR